MDILCRCTSCSAPFKVDAKFAGRKARCPKCATVVAVPSNDPSPEPASTASDETSAASRSRFLESPPAAESTTALDFPELRSVGGGVVINPTVEATPPPVADNRPPRPAVERRGATDSRIVISARPAPSAVPPVAPVSPAASETGGSEKAPVPEHSFVVTTRSARGIDRRKGRGGMRTIPKLYWVAGGGVLALLVAIGCIFVVAAYLSGRSPQLSTLGGKTVLELNWPEPERKGAALTINGKDYPIDPSGPLEFPLEAGTHRLTLRRRGYEQIDYGFSLRKGERHPFTPSWHKSPFSTPDIPKPDKNSTPPAVPPGDGGFASAPLNFNGWAQSLEGAQRRARERKRDILLVFAGSDWNTDSIQMATDIFSQTKFRQFAEPRFEMVVIDLPRTEAGFNLLADVAQNRALFRKFGVRTVPTVALLDAAGAPYAIDGVFRESLDKYIQHLTLLQAKHNTRDARLAAVDAAKNKPPEQRLAACAEAVEWLSGEKVQFHYPRFLSQCYALARQVDPRNEMGHLELFFEADWEARLRQAALNQDQQQAQDLLTELRQWSESHKFTDPDRAVRLHLTAVILFSRNAAGEAEAQRHLELARSYTPHDEELKKQLDALTKTLQTSDQLSSGTGFIIDTRGYILTNHHVIEGPGGTVVRLPGGGNDRVPAQVVAQDAKRDIALLKVDPQRFVRFEAMPITTGKVSRAASVAVFGFPLGDEIGNDVRITTGVVSALPEQSDDGMLLLDCRVNPGNSGGPVLNRAGNVIGMVTAKTDSGFGLDSYGMALPSKDLTAFLAKHLPDFKPPSPGDAGTSKDWEQIDREVEASILMILKVKSK